MAESDKEQENNKVEITEEEAMEILLSGQTKQMDEQGMIPWVFVNDKKNPAPFGLLNMFYAGVFSNTLGIMVAKDTETGEERAVLVGISKNEDGSPAVYPVALVLGEAETKRFLPPDGKGSYVEFPTEH